MSRKFKLPTQRIRGPTRRWSLNYPKIYSQQEGIKSGKNPLNETSILSDNIKEKLLKGCGNVEAGGYAKYYCEEGQLCDKCRAKLSQHSESTTASQNRILEIIKDWWANTMKISSTSTDLEDLTQKIKEVER